MSISSIHGRTPGSSPSRLFTDDETRWQAVVARDARADGIFLYAVLTTGVYCFPSCASRPSRRENVRFFDDRCAASAAGYRPCLRCLPDGESPARRRAALVEEACRRLATDSGDGWPGISVVADAMGLSRNHLQRQFKACLGIGPKAWQLAERRRRLEAGLVDAPNVLASAHEAGFSSSARLYEDASSTGMTPGRRAAGGAGETIRYAVGDCELGRLLVATSDRGICAILFGDDDAQLAADLAARFPAAVLEHDEQLVPGLSDVIARTTLPEAACDLPLDIRGTAFQRAVWNALRQIPIGETRSYSEIAADIDRPGAQRAVAQACAANSIAMLVPCHRVVRGDGKLSGYRWGIERKAALLARERLDDNAVGTAGQL